MTIGNETVEIADAVEIAIRTEDEILIEKDV